MIHTNDFEQIFERCGILLLCLLGKTHTYPCRSAQAPEGKSSCSGRGPSRMPLLFTGRSTRRGLHKRRVTTTGSIRGCQDRIQLGFSLAKPGKTLRSINLQLNEERSSRGATAPRYSHNQTRYYTNHCSLRLAQKPYCEPTLRPRI